MCVCGGGGGGGGACVRACMSVDAHMQSFCSSQCSVCLLFVWLGGRGRGGKGGGGQRGKEMLRNYTVTEHMTQHTKKQKHDRAPCETGLHSFTLHTMTLKITMKLTIPILFSPDLLLIITFCSEGVCVFCFVF